MLISRDFCCSNKLPQLPVLRSLVQLQVMNELFSLFFFIPIKSLLNQSLVNIEEWGFQWKFAIIFFFFKFWIIFFCDLPNRFSDSS